MPKKVRLRLKVKDTDSASLKHIISELRSQYNIQDVTIQKVNALNTVANGKKISFGNVRDVEWQNKVITEYLDNEYALDDDMLDVVRHINRTVHSKLTQSDITRNKLWIPKTFEFSNMFSYGEDNVIDFGNLSGTYGLFAPNASGKSTLLDALAFCCFDKCSRTSKAVHVLNNKKSQFRSKFCFEMDGIDYYIERNGRKNNGGHVKVDVNFYYHDDSGNQVSLNGEQRDNTNKMIRHYLGDYEDFVLTALSLQGNNTGSFICHKKIVKIY
jgi:predicted ATP-dependent endonuclease of OLD family